MLKDFFSLLFPQVCAACGKALYKEEQSLCMMCVYKLPKTDFHEEKDNPVEKVFWGRVQVVAGASYYRFAKGGSVQHLIHELKYNGQWEVGVTIGNLYGRELKNCERFKSVDLIVPVPLHKRKIRVRGYNQSEAFAQGLSKSMNLETNFNVLYRDSNSETQTKKKRFLRWGNVETIFQVRDEITLQGKHILLVDDVLTTGATLEACVLALQRIPNVKVSVATIAYVSRSFR